MFIFYFLFWNKCLYCPPEMHVRSYWSSIYWNIEFVLQLKAISFQNRPPHEIFTALVLWVSISLSINIPYLISMKRKGVRERERERGIQLKIQDGMEGYIPISFVLLGTNLMSLQEPIWWHKLTLKLTHLLMNNKPKEILPLCQASLSVKSTCH